MRHRNKEELFLFVKPMFEELQKSKNKYKIRINDYKLTGQVKEYLSEHEVSFLDSLAPEPEE